MYDYTDAPPPQFELVPHGTIADISFHIRPGGVGEDKLLKRSRDGGCEMLDVEFTLVDGAYAKRKFWGLFTVAGTTLGHVEAARISNGKLRAILESARGIKPDDQSDAAKEARRVSSYGDFNGLVFMVRIGVEPPQNGYRAKNRLDQVITPDQKAWHAVTQEPVAAASTTSAKPASTPAKIERPKWAHE